MALERKHIFLIIGGVLILGAIGVGIYLLTKPKAKDDDPEKRKEEEKKEKETSPNGANTPPKTPVTQPSIPGKVTPIFDEENQISNKYSELKDRVLYPKRKAMGGWDYTNVRTTPEVNNESGWYDPFDNLLTTINAGTPIGKVIGEEAGVYNNFSYRWFKVKLLKQIGFWKMDIGYVRADTVTFAPYDK